MSLAKRRRLLPYILIAPGLTWLVVFYLIPALNQVYVSLEDGNIEQGYSFQWNWTTYSTAIDNYGEQFIRSLGYAGAATILAFIIAFPLAYFIAFKAGRFKNFMLLLIVLPFFTSYLVRTIAWQTILRDDGFVVNTFQAVGLLGDNGRLLATRNAVIAGITYNFLPFMALPLYVLAREDRQAADRGGHRPLRLARDGLPQGDAATRAAGHLRRVAADVHSGGGRLHQRAAARDLAPVHDRKRHPVEVPGGDRLPDRRGAVVLLMAILLVAILVYARALGTRSLVEATV